MAAKAPEAPLSESARIAKERRKLALEEARQRKAADVGLFGDISVVFVPPDPAKEEPPADEPLSEEDKAIERAYQDSASPASLEDVAAVEALAGALEPEELDEELAAALETLHDAQAVQAGREAFVEHVLEPMADALARELEEPLGPDSFGGEDGLPAPSAETLRRQIAETAQSTDLSTGRVGTTLEEEAEVVSAGSAAPSAPSGFSLFGHNLFGDEVKAKSTGPLSDRFKLPPFTVFDARQGVWQDRKRAWLSLGIQSEVGRGENLIGRSPQELFSHATGIAYKEAREIVTRAMAELGEAFNVEALIDQYGRRRTAKAFGQDFTLGPQPKTLKDGSVSGAGKSWPKKETAATAVSQRLAPGGGGGGCWIGGPKTASTEKFAHHTVSSGNAMEYAGFKVDQSNSTSGTSIFDPVLTELVYSWFAPPEALILDPFAGGSVRGIVASKLGRKYVGIELRPEQIAANEVQAEKICAGDAQAPLWIEGDSTNAKDLTDGASFDFIMACPPYGDLEQYSDDPRDLSNMSYEAFALAYSKIIAAAVELLKPDRFACYVIGDIRDDEGFYRGLPELTVRAFEEVGARKYNEGILVTAVGSLPIRIGKQFNSGRKLGKTHQNVLIFCKGDPKKAAEACNGQMELPA